MTLGPVTEHDGFACRPSTGDHSPVRVDLIPRNADFSDHIEGPDGTVYLRQSSRLGRSRVDELVAWGIPLVVSWFGGHQLDRFDGDDALPAWRERRAHFTSEAPVPTSKRLRWTGGLHRTQNLERSLVVLTGHC